MGSSDVVNVEAMDIVEQNRLSLEDSLNMTW